MSKYLPSTQGEWREFRVAIFLLAVVGFMVWRFYAFEARLDAELAARGIDIMRMVEGR